MPTGFVLRAVTGNHRFQCGPALAHHEIAERLGGAITAGRALRVLRFPVIMIAPESTDSGAMPPPDTGPGSVPQFGLFQTALLIDGVKKTGLCQLISRLMNS